MITNVGINSISDLLTTEYNYIGIGSGNIVSTLLDTELESQIQIGETTNSIETTTSENDTSVFLSDIRVTEDCTVKELGLFSEETSGNMFLRNVIPNVVLKDGYTLRVYIKIISSENNG